MQPGLTGFAFGTISLSNGSPGCTPKASSYVLNGLGRLGGAGLGFSSGSELSSGSERKSLHTGLNFAPNWTGDTRGPVPLVIAVYDYRSPSHPNADASKVQRGKFFGMGEFPFLLKAAE